MVTIGKDYVFDGPNNRARPEAAFKMVGHDFANRTHH
jgi:hypothetical protein